MATSYDLKVLFNESKDESEKTESENGLRHAANWTVWRKLQLNLLHHVRNFEVLKANSLKSLLFFFLSPLINKEIKPRRLRGNK